jgi:hypothetical protein
MERELTLHIGKKEMIALMMRTNKTNWICTGDDIGDFKDTIENFFHFISDTDLTTVLQNGIMILICQALIMGIHQILELAEKRKWKRFEQCSSIFYHF